MRPNFALHRLVEGVRLNEGEVRALRVRFGARQSGLAQAFPRTRMVPMGSYSRGRTVALLARFLWCAIFRFVSIASFWKSTRRP
jgi:hypothetical protein